MDDLCWLIWFYSKHLFLKLITYDNFDNGGHVFSKYFYCTNHIHVDIILLFIIILKIFFRYSISSYSTDSIRFRFRVSQIRTVE